jgi:hypothetical protein
MPLRRVFTIMGWSPGLRDIVGSRVLACGCLTGSYITGGSRVIVVLDEHDIHCENPAHQTDAILDIEALIQVSRALPSKDALSESP